MIRTLIYLPHGADDLGLSDGWVKLLEDLLEGSLGCFFLVHLVIW